MIWERPQGLAGACPSSLLRSRASAPRAPENLPPFLPASVPGRSLGAFMLTAAPTLINRMLPTDATMPWSQLRWVPPLFRRLNWSQRLALRLGRRLQQGVGAPRGVCACRIVLLPSFSSQARMHEPTVIASL
jgi:hypothetical protein